MLGVYFCRERERGKKNKLIIIKQTNRERGGGEEIIIKNQPEKWHPPKHLHDESSLCPPGAAAGPRESRAAAGATPGPPGSSALCASLRCTGRKKRKEVEMKTFQLCFLPPPFPHRNACGVTSTPPRRCCGVMGVTRAGGAKSGAAPSPLLSLTSTLLASAFQPRKPGVLWEEVRLPQSRSFPKSVSSIFFPFRKEKPFVVKRWVFWSSPPPPCACFCPLQLHGIGAAWS